jgi:cob(I)alamin adenosyltransferase
MTKKRQGYVHLYTGDGKGKTTAALGLAFRAAGHGLKSHIIQFMKGQIGYGELKSAKKTGGLIRITQCGRASFVSRDNPDPKDVRLAEKALEMARREMEKAEVDILILDEINCALDFKLISQKDVLELIRKRPAGMELVLTGRWAPRAIIQAADLVTEMKEVKHYWKKGVQGRKGIEK